MSIPYLVRKKVSVIGGNKKVRWYAVQKKLQERGGKTEEDVARIVAERAGFREGEVQGILTDVSLVLGELLAEGYSVNLKGNRYISGGSYQSGSRTSGRCNSGDSGSVAHLFYSRSLVNTANQENEVYSYTVVELFPEIDAEQRGDKGRESARRFAGREIGGLAD